LVRGARALLPYAILTFALPALADRWKVSDQADIRQSFELRDTSKPTRLEVDNVNGSIEVVGEDRKDVQLVALRRTKARSEEALAQANQEVQLDIEANEGGVVLFVDGPFRCGKNCMNCRDNNRYHVEFEFQLRVPRRTDLDLKTVNGGEIVVRGVEGDFEVNNVNGGVEMTDQGGSGRVDVINGEVHIVFAQNPREASRFYSLNGDVDVSFRSNLAANLRASTSNGEIYSAFDGEQLPPRSVIREVEDGHTMYKLDGSSGLRVGSGGPEIEFETFNGDIRIRKLD
jgi:DUF4097 and DUF4098 domain-containing protein YvlB